MGATRTTNPTNMLPDSKDEEYLIPRQALLRVLKGVGMATKTSAEGLSLLEDRISSLQPERNQSEYACSLAEWHNTLLQSTLERRSQQLGVLAICVAYLREHSRKSQCAPVSSPRMQFIWDQIYGVLTDRSLDPPLCNAVRSSQGFFSVALCSLIEDGNIDELFRLHVWLPDHKRGQDSFKVHSHQPFAHSWILAGEGTNIPFDIEPADTRTATHAAYVLAWSDGNSLSSTYSPHHPSSVVANTGQLRRAIARQSEAHTRDMTYVVPSAHFHTSVIAPDALHATFFFFDAQRGFDKDAGVLGPVDGETFEARRDPAGVTASHLAQMAQAVRSFEIFIDSGTNCLRQGQFGEAKMNYDSALHLSQCLQDFPNPQRYTQLALDKLAAIKRLNPGIISSNADVKEQMDQPLVGMVDPSH